MMVVDISILHLRVSIQSDIRTEELPSDAAWLHDNQRLGSGKKSQEELIICLDKEYLSARS